ncbi:MAG TPA: hypothetical protein VF812_09290 [Ktedonobacterales bacterium]
MQLFIPTADPNGGALGDEIGPTNPTRQAHGNSPEIPYPPNSPVRGTMGAVYGAMGL